MGEGRLLLGMFLGRGVSWLIGGEWGERGWCTVYADAVTEFYVVEDGGAVCDCEGGAAATAFGVIVVDEGGDGWLVLVRGGFWDGWLLVGVGGSLLPIVSTRPVNMFVRGSGGLSIWGC